MSQIAIVRRVVADDPGANFFDSRNGEGGGVLGQGNMVEQVTVNGSTLVSSTNVINDGSPINPSGPTIIPRPDRHNRIRGRCGAE